MLRDRRAFLRAGLLLCHSDRPQCQRSCDSRERSRWIEDSRIESRSTSRARQASMTLPPRKRIRDKLELCFRSHRRCPAKRRGYSVPEFRRLSRKECGEHAVPEKSGKWSASPSPYCNRQRSRRFPTAPGGISEKWRGCSPSPERLRKLYRWPLCRRLPSEKYDWIFLPDPREESAH